jgi:hypothetical protein
MLQSLNLASFSSLAHTAAKNASARRRRESAPAVRFSNRAKPPVTRSRLTSSGSSSRNSDQDYSPNKRRLSEDSDDEPESATAKRKRVTTHSCPSRWLKNPNKGFVSPAKVTQHMMNNVSTHSGSKVLNQV